MLEVRDALPTEYDAVGEQVADVYLAEEWSGPDYATTLRDVAARAREATVLVALVDDTLVGSVTVALSGGSFAEQAGPGEAVIRMLVTTPSARGNGVGVALMNEALRRARESGCTAVRLSTQPGMSSAHRLYERLGFTRQPERDWSPVKDVHLLAYCLVLRWCGHCGEPGEHADCTKTLELEPPRYCGQCRRRMVVQVYPTGWSASCVEHGVLAS